MSLVYSSNIKIDLCIHSAVSCPLYPVKKFKNCI